MRRRSDAAGGAARRFRRVAVVAGFAAAPWCLQLPVVQAMPLPPWLPRHYRADFRWVAALDGATGVATSKESSAVPPDSPLGRFAHRPATASSDLLRALERAATAYPVWLCRGAVTLGLLQAVPDPGNGGGGGGYRIRTRLLALDLLAFGVPRAQRLEYRQDDAAAARSVRTTLCTVSLPIGGGLLALPPPRGGDHNTDKCGALLFTLRRDQTCTTEAAAAVAGDAVAEARTTTSTRTTLRTALVRYRPRLAGGGSSSSLSGESWRHQLQEAVGCGTYRALQAPVHAYIMWRFHRALWALDAAVGGGGGDRGAD